MKVIVTFQQMKRELLGFWQVRLAKSKGLSVLQHLPTRHMENHGHDTQHHGQLLEQAHTGRWQRTGTWAFTVSCWEAYSGFSLWEASPKEDTTRKYFVFFQAKLQTLGSWLCQTDALLGAKPAWSCQKIKLETHMGLNQTERQSCREKNENSSWSIGQAFFLWLHGLGMSQ